ncbi:hypothetical protein DLJ54_08840 [Corynebacterium heidelbergense]|uniref:DUF559 domain-containing protein n=2 Tax=Corynebacterium heidelbergense TaxID=2055947 RepID=A0A364V3Y6_9CORY|nr:hypothetical protein DLJ54_08840 [Corynebacterium heidelbergense]
MISVPDMGWKEQRILIYFDGSLHRDQERFENDQSRMTRLTLAGYRFFRFTRRDLHNLPLVRQLIQEALTQ